MFKQEAEAILKDYGVEQSPEAKINWAGLLTALEELHKDALEAELTSLDIEHEPHLCECYVMNIILPKRLKELREQLKGKDNV